MSPIERDKFIESMKAMTDEEKVIALTCFPTKMLKDELERREVATARKVDEINQIVRESLDKEDILENREEYIKILKNALI